MTLRLSLIFVLVSGAIAGVLSAASNAPTDRITAEQTAAASDTVAFVDVTVVPMDRERLIERQTVIVRGDRIEAMGTVASTPVPAGARRIDAQGQFLMPGLVDMHVHVSPGGGEAGDPAGRTLRLLLANGITTARSMIGHPTHLALRDGIARGAIVGPSVVAAGPPLWGKELPTPDAAIKIVREQHAAGYDFVKLIVGFQSSTYEAIVNTARDVGIPVAGHVDLNVGLPLAMRSRQQVEHLDAFLEQIVADDATARRSNAQLDPGAILDSLDERKIPGLVQSIRAAGTYNCPTLSLFRRVASDETADALAARPEMRYVTSQSAQAWRNQLAGMRSGNASAARRARFVEIRNRLTKALADGGAPLMAGSDSPQLFMVAGFALHEELASLVAAGLSPYQALRAATVTPSEYLKQSDQWGTVAVGKRADMVLLTSNPLADVKAASRNAGVITRGRWFSAGDLRGMLDGVEASAKAQP